MTFPHHQKIYQDKLKSCRKYFKITNDRMTIVLILFLQIFFGLEMSDGKKTTKFK
jgi:hypothetical protein